MAIPVAASARRKPRATRPLPGRVRATLNRAIQAHQRGELDVAGRLYHEVLRMEWAQPDALHYLGVLEHQRGRGDKAVELIESALAVVPDYPDALNNLGNVHKECGRLAEAEACYRRALACAPGHGDAWSNLAVVLEAQERLQEACDARQAVVQHAPHGARGFWMLGQFLLRHPGDRTDLERAVASLNRARELDARNIGVLRDLGVALYALDRRDEACAVYRDWLAREPGNPVPRHMLAASGGAAAPARADDDYVSTTFDRFADSFDAQLLQHLGYRAPQVLAAALQRVLPPADATLDVLDAGCGTGLCAPWLRPYARRLVGVDLSDGMLEMARRRGGYDELANAELTRYVAQRADAWDVIVAADTLVYFGDLAEVCVAARAALRTGGWFAFSLEAGDGEGFELAPSGRYRHPRGYIETTLRAAGFHDIDVQADSLRREAGQPVASWVVLARNAPRVDQRAHKGDRA